MSKSRTPQSCIADFCLVPVGVYEKQYTLKRADTSQLGLPSPSVSAQVAEVQRFIKKSGLKYSMHSAGTTVGQNEYQYCSSEQVTGEHC